METLQINNRDWTFENLSWLPSSWEQASTHLDQMFALSADPYEKNFLENLNSRIKGTEYEQSVDYARHFSLMTEAAARLGFTAVFSLTEQLNNSRNWPFTAKSVASYHFQLAGIFSYLETMKYSFLQSADPLVAEIQNQRMHAYTYSNPANISEHDFPDLAEMSPQEISQSRFRHMIENIVDDRFLPDSFRYANSGPHAAAPKYPQMHLACDPFFHAIIERRDEIGIYHSQLTTLYKTSAAEAASTLGLFSDIYASVGVQDIAELTRRLDS